MRTHHRDILFLAALVSTLLAAALACTACGGQPTIAPTATPALPATAAMPAGTTLATVPPTASPSPTSGPTPPATRQSIRLPADTIALYGLGKEQSLDLYALGNDGSATGLGVQIDRGWLVSHDGRWAVLDRAQGEREID